MDAIDLASDPDMPKAFIRFMEQQEKVLEIPS